MLLTITNRSGAKQARFRGRRRTPDQYVNDDPYVASLFLSVGIAAVLGSALSGKSKIGPS
jgi:hypothetical protein